MPKLKHTLLFLAPVLAGAAVLMFMAKNKSGPQQTGSVEMSRAVRVVAAERLTVVPRVIGYGRVQPDRTWEGVAEVSGRVIEVHPDLIKGALIPAGEVLLRIDPTDYELAVAQTRADIRSLEVQLAELETKEANARASLKIEQDKLKLREAEVRRKRTLVQKGTLSASDFEQEQRNLLSQRQAVQSQQSTLNLLPTERARLQAQLAREQARLAAAERDLERTVIHMPFRGRLAEARVEEAQYVRQGNLLVKADSIDKAEIEAQVPLARMRTLLRSGQRVDAAHMSSEEIKRALPLQARVWLRGDGGDVVWEAKFVGIGDTLDPATRTVGVIVHVDDPYGNIIPGIRPPLVKGLFTEVELRGIARTDRLVIPRNALHGNTVYVAGKDDRLEIRPVETEMVEAEYAVITSGLNTGERVVVSDLSPAVEGMKLVPTMDEAAANTVRVATGGAQP
jgi:RND family efflux transporter MFP subunit